MLGRRCTYVPLEMATVSVLWRPGDEAEEPEQAHQQAHEGDGYKDGPHPVRPEQCVPHLDPQPTLPLSSGASGRSLITRSDGQYVGVDSLRNARHVARIGSNEG